MKLEQSDFILVTCSVYWYRFTANKPIKGLYLNWPFHETEKERKEFLESLGVHDDEYTTAFPEMPTPEQALILLVTAINDYNKRKCLY